MASNNILQQDQPVYHRFVDNQVLTEEQLNQMLDHLNYQDKTTRTSLIGVGVVCGLELQLAANKVSLSPGVAVTTDGDVLKTKATTFTGYKIFRDENVRYQHFLQGDTTMDLYALEENTTPTNVFPLGQFSAKTGIPQDRIVALLYLEDYLAEEEDCDPVDCNAQGREVVNNLRVLLTSVETAQKIAAKDSIFSGTVTSTQEDVLGQLVRVLPKRVVISPASGASLGSLKSAYAINFFSLRQRIQQLGRLSLFQPVLEAVNLNIGLALSNVTVTNANFQYVHDFYRDLATAYNELLVALQEEYAICCPDPSAFPKHVLLGELAHTPAYLRHAFYPSPLHRREASIANLRGMFTRILQMIRAFKPEAKADVRITPSRNAHYPLGERALPFYFNLGAAANPEVLIGSWGSRKGESPLNYYRYKYPSIDFEPLDYCLDGHDFYRVEGHVGKGVTDAVKRIQTIRDQKGLAFQVVPIAVGATADEDTLDYEKYNMYFEDLQVILQAWNEEQKCLIEGSSRFLTRFSVEEKGIHLDYKYMAAASGATERAPAGMNLNLGMDIGAAAKKAAEAAYQVATAKTEKQNAVLYNIDESSGAIGAVYGKNLKASDGGSDIQVKMVDAVKDAVKDWEEELQVAVVDIPAVLLGKMKVTEDNKLLKIEDFTEANLKKYIESLQAQCDAAKEAKKKLQQQVAKPSSQLQSQAYLENYFFVLNRLISSCCLVEKVKVLYEKIIERKKELLGKMVLKEYAKAHPGAEHQAGVPAGGTFIVLYFSAEKPAAGLSVVEAESAVRVEAAKAESAINMINLENLGTGGRAVVDIRAGSTEKAFDLRAALMEGLGRTNPQLLEMLGKELGGLLARPEQVALAHGTVIGDLCLPYICCTDTPATTFVFPDQKVALFIGKSHICRPVEGEAEHLLLEVTPLDGNVRAFIGGQALEGAILTNNGNQFFNPNQVAASDFGKTISFTVNDQNVEPTLKVVQRPEPAFSVGEEVAFSNENQVARVTIQNTSVSIPGQTFSWNFGQGDPRQLDALSFEHFYQVKPGGTYNFTINLTATNASCTASAEQVLTIQVPQLEQPDNCPEETRDALRGAINSIERTLEANPRELGQQGGYYVELVKPRYEMLIKNTDQMITGSFDAETYEFIQTNQQQLTQMIQRGDYTQVQLAFLLQLYYENLLLYFYLQACRDSRISARAGITNLWEEFTASAADVFVESMRALLKQVPFQSRIEDVLARENERLSGPMKDLLAKLIDLLKQASG